MFEGHVRKKSLLIPRRQFQKTPQLKKKKTTTPAFFHIVTEATKKLKQNQIKNNLRRTQKKKQNELWIRQKILVAEEKKDVEYRNQEIRKLEKIRVEGRLPQNRKKPLSRLGRSTEPKEIKNTRDDYLLKKIRIRPSTAAADQHSTTGTTTTLNRSSNSNNSNNNSSSSNTSSSNTSSNRNNSSSMSLLDMKYRNDTTRRVAKSLRRKKQKKKRSSSYSSISGGDGTTTRTTTTTNFFISKEEDKRIAILDQPNTWSPPLFPNKEQLLSLPKHVQRGPRIVDLKSKDKINTTINQSWEERHLGINFLLRKIKRLTTTMNQIKKFGIGQSFDMTATQRELLKMEVSLGILERDDDHDSGGGGGGGGGGGDSEERTEKDNKRQRFYKTTPSYMKHMMSTQRQALDVLLNETTQTLELMELGVTPTEHGPVLVAATNTKSLLRSVQRAANEHREECIQFQKIHMEKLKKKNYLFADPASFYTKNK